jgi:hypothetical protein
MVPVVFYLIVARRLTYVRVWRGKAIVGLLPELRTEDRVMG